MQKHFTSIRELLQHHLLTNEDSETQALMNALRHIKPHGYFDKSDFLAMCKWKDKRPLRRRDWESNNDADVLHISRQVFATADECRQIALLERLKGVNVSFASAILTLTDPTRYGVIDIRVWQVLYLYQEVAYSADGRNLKFAHGLDYLPKLRQWASEFNVSARNIEYSLFRYHSLIQERALYS